MIIEPLQKIIIDNKEFIEISNFAVPGISRKSYFINTDGEIYSLLSNKYMNPSIAINGYYIINLKLENGNYQVFYLHRIIMITYRFIYNYNEMQVNHINGIKTDNRLCNLEWVTLQENNLHAKNTGLLCTGENCPFAKLSELEVREICQILESGNYTTLTDIANKYNCSISIIADIARGNTWKDVSCNYNINYNIRARFTNDQVHFMCRVFRDNKEKSFDYLYHLAIFYMGLPEDRFIRRRIYKIYKKDPNNFYYITSQYDY